MALSVFNELAHLAPIIREGVEIEAGLAKSALRGAFKGAVSLSHVGSTASITLKGMEESMSLATFMERVLSEDAGLLKTLEKEMTPAGFKELSSALTAAKGMSTLTEESFHMLSGVRSSLDDVAESLRVLKTENRMTAEAFEKALKDSAQQSAKSAELFNTYKTMSSEIAVAASKKTGFTVVGKVFAYAALPTAAGIWAFLHNYAKKNSGCYIFSKKDSAKYRVMDLSNGMGLKVASCGGCNLTQETRESASYGNFKTSGEVCDKDLCKLESLEPPYCDNKLYSMCCIKLDEADALADITSNIAGGIGTGITNFAYNFSKKMAPFAIMAGLGYLGFVYITTPRPAGPMAMISSPPNYTRLDEGPRKKKLTSRYLGSLKQSHP